MKKKCILITGGSGFAASHLVEALIKQGYNNLHLTSYSKNAGYINHLVAEKQIHQINLCHEEATFNLIKKVKPAQIYHLAALSSVGSSFTDINAVLNNNLNLQLNLLNGVKKFAPDCRLLIIGSGLEYQKSLGKISENDPLGPENPYSVSKVFQSTLAYAYAQNFHLDLVIARPFNHIGERQALGFVVSDFAKQIVEIEQLQSKNNHKTAKLKVGNLQAIRDFTDVKDMVTAYILLMEKGKTGEIFNIGSGQGYKIEDLLKMMLKLSPAKFKIQIDPNRIRPLDNPQVIADNKKIRKLGWKTTITIEKTLERVLNWWRNNL